MRIRLYFVYIMSNHSRVLYVGITNNLGRRMSEHREGIDPMRFTTRYRLRSLVYYEEFLKPSAAIAREKQIKAYRRSKKIALIEALNPGWVDLTHAQIPPRLRGSE